MSVNYKRLASSFQHLRSHGHKCDRDRLGILTDAVSLGNETG